MPLLLNASLAQIQSLPGFGSSVLAALLVSSAYTFAVAILAARGRPRLLRAARLGAYGTCALVLLATVLLAYAFVTHDFRIRYVARYSDRSMPTAYLLTALWGGQDGSLLWWLFLQSIFVAAAVRWLQGRYRQLQPYVIATFMAVFLFFGAMMLFAADPFQINLSGTRPDGTGLNPLLMNYWMVIHPPALYTGFVGCTVPYAFAIAALLSGRLDNEWVVATRKWMLFAWLFLSIGNALGMIWAYEELGWGGFWAWDPVENAGLLPWLAASAYVHSTMIQERRNQLRAWNVILICLTFFLTIFGTFLTRSGLIASVHSFAKSDIGVFFIWAMVLIVTVNVALIAWRWPRLRQHTHLESLASRESTFVINNWALVGFLTFVAVSTTTPLITQALQSEAFTWWASVLLGAAIGATVWALGRRFGTQKGSPDRRGGMLLARLDGVWIAVAVLLLMVAVWWLPGALRSAAPRDEVVLGPPFYNSLAKPFGLFLFALMGLCPLFGWGKTSTRSLKKALPVPAAAFAVAAALHGLFGTRLGLPPIVEAEPPFAGALGVVLQKLDAIGPLLGVSLVAFNLTVIIQEFARGVGARQRAAERKGSRESAVTSLVQLLTRNRRRYGGYTVHLGIVLIFLGFVGQSWVLHHETTLAAGDVHEIGPYRLSYVGPRICPGDPRCTAEEQADQSKTMLFGDFDVIKDGAVVGQLSPAKFTYRRMPDSPTSEVGLRRGLRDDLYVVAGSISPDPKGRSSFRFYVNPFVSWIWLGLLAMIAGSALSLWPELRYSRLGAWGHVRPPTGARS